MKLPGVWRTVPAELAARPVSHRARDGVGVPVLMVHGIGPGTTGALNFAPLIERLPLDCPAHLIDLAGFGDSSSARRRPGFAVSLWLDQIDQALERIGRPAVLVGNSVGAALSLKIAARRSDLHAVVAIAAPAAPMRPTAELTAFWRAPRDPEDLAAAMRPMTAAAEPADPEAVAVRWRPFLDVDYAEWFSETLADPEACLAAVALTATEAARVDAPLRVLHGRQDRACPAAPLVSMVMEALPEADLTVLAGCGHNVITERTPDVLAAVERSREKGQRQ